MDDHRGELVVLEARERTKIMSGREKRRMLVDFRDKSRQDPNEANTLLGVDATAAMALVVAQLELGLLLEDSVVRAAEEDAKARLASATDASDARPEYSQYQIELLRQVDALTPEMMQGLSPFQQQQLITLQHMIRTRGLIAGRR
jgi:hypothetical protein